MDILDTDHLSLIQRNGESGKRILARLAAINESEVAVTVITYEEQVKGRLSLLTKAKTMDEQVFAYVSLSSSFIYMGLEFLLSYSFKQATDQPAIAGLFYE